MSRPTFYSDHTLYILAFYNNVNSQDIVATPEKNFLSILAVYILISLVVKTIKDIDFSPWSKEQVRQEAV